MDIAVHDGVHGASHGAVHLALHHAVDPHPAAGRIGVEHHMMHGERCHIHQLAAHQQDLRQDEQHQEDGDDGTAAQALADAHDAGIGRHLTDQGTGHRHDGAGGEDGGERKVQRLDHGRLMVHLIPQLVVAGCNDDGVIDVCTHLDGADDQVAHEVQRRVDKSGDGEVDPDRALDDEDQQDGHCH